MAITINTGFLRTVPGILKLLECALVLIVLLIARFGGDDGIMMHWSSNNNTFLGIGTCVGYAIIVPAIILTYLLGSSPSILEFIINLVGGILFISMGATVVSYDGLHSVLGGLAIATGIVFLIDFCYLCITRKVTIIHTSRNVA